MEFKLQRGIAETWRASDPPQDLGIIDSFLTRDYHRGHYEQLAQRALDLITKAMSDSRNLGDEKVQAKVTCRAKGETSLKEKLIMRNESKRYKNSDDIWNDIPDLAGVRMILYMPNDEQRKRVKEIIHSIWGPNVKLVQHGRPAMIDQEIQVDEADLPKLVTNGNRNYAASSSMIESPKSPPKSRKRKPRYIPKHLGYEADHYRAVMQEQQSGLTEKGRYNWRQTDKVEVQVMSALTHAWAEAGHDILYKQHAFGTPTRDEQRILDSLRGLVSSGDLLLEQFHESVNKRTYARIQHRDEFGTFLRNLDVLQVEDEVEDVCESKEPRTETNISRYQEDFKSEGVDILFDFLVNQDKNYPLAVRSALKNLGYPDDPTGNASEILESFDPYLEVPDGLLAPFCLIYQMMPPRKPPTPPSLPEQCRTIITALTLLQTFAGSPQVAGCFLGAKHGMTPKEKISLQFFLSDHRRLAFFTEAEKGLEQFTRAMPQSVWQWFQKQAERRNSVCGFLFHLAEMGVAKENDTIKLVTRLHLTMPPATS